MDKKDINSRWNTYNTIIIGVNIFFDYTLPFENSVVVHSSAGTGGRSSNNGNDYYRDEVRYILIVTNPIFIDIRL